ncbi:hypothetical protein YC2023_066789 [Brassica napus]
MDNLPTDASRPLKRNSNDVGWEYGVLCDPRNADKVKCKLCGKQFSGGIFRMKEHIAHVKGNVAACPVSTKADQDKCKKAILDAKEKKNLKRKHDQDLRAEVNINRDSNVEELEKQIGTLKSPHFQGPIDQWIFQSNISFNAIDNDSFRLFCEALGQFGPGWVPPSQYQLREPLLNEERQRTKEMLKSLEEEWEKEGCSVMTDAWSDMKRRSIMNLCVNSRGDDGNEDTVEEWLVGRVQDIDSDLGLLLSTQAPRVRDLYDDDFESEEEEEYVVDMEFEPDVYQDIPSFRESQQQPI